MIRYVCILALALLGSVAVAFGPRVSVPRRPANVLEPVPLSSTPKAEDTATGTDLTEEQVGLGVFVCFASGWCPSDG
jgi:hypothetical protein